MPSINCPELLAIARSTGVFYAHELDILCEVLEKSTDIGMCAELTFVPDYILITVKQESQITGFIIFGKVSMTQASWDIYWIVVRKDCQGKGLGKNLVMQTERYIKENFDKGNLRLETSSRKEYDATRAFYLRTGFTQAGIIEDFYAPGDSLVIFCKKI